MKNNLEIIKLKLKLAIMIVLMSVLIMPSLSFAALEEFYSATGKIFTSVDGAGSNDAAGHSINVEKPSSSATVRRAFLMESSVSEVINDGDVQLDGNPINWDECSVPLPFLSLNSCRADVTALVKPIMDAEPAGIRSFTLTETSSLNINIDGEVLVVVFDDPTETNDQTVILMHGFQSTTGDNFAITFADPIDPSAPGALADMGLGIGFGFQSVQNVVRQFSQINVNGTRLTTSAGGNDDGDNVEGGLITVGGLGDTNTNPIDPFQEPNGDPRLDDELYSILPFLTSTNTGVNVSTENPSNDDLIFFVYFNLSTAAIEGGGIVLSPVTATNPVRTDHTVTATVLDDNSDPIADREVTFNVIAGPNNGNTGTGTTDFQGEAIFTYFDTAGPGTDRIQASFLSSNSAGNPEVSNIVEKIWRIPPESLELSPVMATNPVGTDHTVTAMVVDENGNPIVISGREITFTVMAGPNSGKTGTGTTDDPQGEEVTFTYTDTEGPGTDQIVASFQNSVGITDMSDPVEKTWRGEEIALSPLTATNPVGTDHTVTAMVTDRNSDPIVDREVTFNVIAGPNIGITGTGTTDDPQGEVTFTYTDTEGPGTDVIQALFVNSDGEPVESTSVENIWFVEEISLFPEVATNLEGTNHTLRAIVTDDNLNPITGREVTFTVIEGPNQDVTGSQTTNAQGEAFFTYTDMNGPGTDQIQASFLNSAGITILSTIVDNIWRGSDRIALSPVTAINPVLTDHTVTALVSNANGNPIANRAVTFTVMAGPNTGNTGTGSTDPQGEAIFTYTDMAGPGTDQILASFLNFAGEIVVSNMVEKVWEIVPPTRCDVNGDLLINLADINMIFVTRNTPASGPDDPRDADGDLTITVNDVRACVLLCALPACQ